MQTQPHHPALSRRAFLAAATASAAGFNLVRPESVRGAPAASRVRLGVIGCGGRGAWICKLFADSGLYELAACSDYFLDRVNAVGQAHGIDPARRFTGLSGYRRLLECPLDAVVIETPPWFHPQQSADAVEAGKHVFVAKPVAVDVPGCLIVADAGRRATARRLVFLVDFQTRASAHYREALAMVRRGDIGRLVMAEANYPWAGGGRGLPPSSAEERLRSWYYVLELSGDFIVEQSIHALDVATWIIGADPVRAIGTGGRKVRPPGSIYDHFAVTYFFPEDLALSFTCIQSIPEVKDEIRARAFGSEGVIDTDYFSGVLVRGREAYRGAEPNLYTTGTEVNIREFHECITTGAVDNATVAPSVRSNLTAILGREAGYRRGEVSWQALLASSERLEPDLRGLRD
jgi:myo-inositol 2-dehydrogenase / D-chiro-inositol 1-dehydrogenase